MRDLITLRIVGLLVLVPTTLVAASWSALIWVVAGSFLENGWSGPVGATVLAILAMGWFGIYTLWRLYYGFLYDRGDSLDRPLTWVGLGLGSLVSGGFMVTAASWSSPRTIFFGWPLLAVAFFVVRLRRGRRARKGAVRAGARAARIPAMESASPSMTSDGRQAVSSTVMLEYEFTTDPARFDIEAIHAFLSRSYWSPDVPRAVVERAIKNSLCFGVLLDGAQVGFARVVTDRATFAYIADVYILEEHRGKGLSKRLMKMVVDHPDLQGLRRMLLATRDAHQLYARFGFKPLAAPERMMEVRRPDVYAGASRTLQS